MRSVAVLSDEQLDRAFGALADPTRRAILARLAGGDAGVLEEMQGSVSPPRPTPEKTAKKRGEGTRP